MKKTLLVSTLILFALSFPMHASFADDSALQQASDASDSGAAAVNSSSDEEAHADASQGFDTAQPPVVDTRTPSEGSSGLSNAPTYDEDTGSGLSNAPTQPSQ